MNNINALKKGGFAVKNKMGLSKLSELLKLMTLLTMLITVIIAAVFTGNSYAEKVLKVAGDKNYPPYEYIDESGNYVGFNVDIMNAISLEMGTKIELIPTEWENAMSMLESGDADLIQGASFSDYRAERFDFSDEVVSNSQSIFVREDNATIFGTSSLNGKTVSVQKNDIAKEIIEENDYKNVKIMEFETQEEAIDSMLNGDVDAFVGNRFTGLYYIQTKDKSDEVKIADELEKTGSYSIAVKKGNEELLKDVNKALKEIRRNGTYEKISKKWLGENIESTEKWKHMFRIISVLLGILVAFVLVSIYLNRKLKKEVDLRTRQINNENILKARILESLNYALVGFDNHGEIKIMNEVASKIIGKKLYLEDSYEDIPLLKKIGIEKLKSERFEKDIEIEENGIQRFLKYRIVPLEYEFSENGFLVMVVDLTREKRSNELLAQNDKMQSIGILSAGIAHELRNPLTSIKMFVDMLPENSKDDEFIEQFIKVVPDELMRLEKLTHTLLDYSKDSCPEPKDINLRDTLEEVMLLIKPYMNKKKINIIEKYQEISLFIDPYQLKQIILNILMNSIDSMVEHGVIEIRTEVENSHAKIVIRDDGCGIDKDRLDKIFDPFYTSKPEGYGIGLSVTKKLVIENRGNINVQSEKGIGTKTTIIFPMNGEEN